MFDTLIVKPIFNTLLGIYSVIPGGDFGIAIILFTILVRFALYPMVRKQLHQTKLMQKIQPELAKIKTQSKGNKQAEAMQMMELYKRHGIKPMQSIGILLVQLPIFIAIFQVIQILTQHRDQVAKFTYDFMENVGPIKALIENPDSFNHKMFGFIDMKDVAIGANGFNWVLVVLAVFSGVTQYIMMKQTSPTRSNSRGIRAILKEAADGKEAQTSDMNAAVANNMMKIMPFFMTFIMLSLSGALSLYYTVSNLVAVAQQHFILKEDTEEMEHLAEEEIIQERAPKRATAKARERDAREANVIRIKANDSAKRKKGKK